MKFLNNQLATFSLLIWFAIMQGMAPFVHHHLGAAIESSKLSFHIHELDVTNPDQLSHKTTVHHAEGFIVNLENVILNKHKVFNADNSANDLILMACIAMMLLPLIAHRLPKVLPTTSPYLSLKHSPQSPRAPPLL